MRIENPPFLSLTAGDLMSTELVVVPQAMSLQGAARMLSNCRVSGVPVVDMEGRCVGVLSASDFVSWAEKGDRAAKRSVESASSVYCPWQLMDTDVLPNDEVRRYMTSDPVTAPPITPMDELARMMVDAHIHRVIVVDAEHRPVGIVSSTDILAAVAYARKKAPVVVGNT